jgi:hypothetical protein
MLYAKFECQEYFQTQTERGKVASPHRFQAVAGRFGRPAIVIEVSALPAQVTVLEWVSKKFCGWSAFSCDPVRMECCLCKSPLVFARPPCNRRDPTGPDMSRKS